jgi:hypothetical protein
MFPHLPKYVSGASGRDSPSAPAIQNLAPCALKKLLWKSCFFRQMRIPPLSRSRLPLFVLSVALLFFSEESTPLFLDPHPISLHFIMCTFPMLPCNAFVCDLLSLVSFFSRRRLYRPWPRMIRPTPTHSMNPLTLS